MIQIAICDDDKEDIVRLRSMLEEIRDKYSMHFGIQEYESGERLLETSLTFHLIFLDVKMSGADGIEVGQQIYKRNRSAKIIFQTNFSQFCQSAMNKSHAFAFLEKPVKKQLLEEQLAEFFKSEGDMEEILVEFKNVSYLQDNIKKEKAVLKIPVRDIIYFEYIKFEKGIRIVTEQGDFKYSEVMKKLEERMRPLGFETSCRGILINIEKVIKIKGYEVILNHGITVPLSQRRVSMFKERLNEYIQDSFH